jgi:fumarate hydratase subunit beta
LEVLTYYKIELPLKREIVSSLRIYDRLELSGSLLVARDQAHQRLYAYLTAGEKPPIALAGETIYYMGPSATPPGRPIGSCGPTTSARMDEFTPAFMDAGLLATIGKGPRNPAVRQAILQHQGVYLVAFGGCGALYATRVVSQEIVAFPELGPEAVFRLSVENFPVIVGMDCLGGSVFA